MWKILLKNDDDYDCERKKAYTRGGNHLSVKSVHVMRLSLKLLRFMSNGRFFKNIQRKKGKFV